MGVNRLPKTVTRQRRDCDLKPGPSVPESSTLTTRLYYLVKYLGNSLDFFGATLGYLLQSRFRVALSTQ